MVENMEKEAPIEGHKAFGIGKVVLAICACIAILYGLSYMIYAFSILDTIAGLLAILVGVVLGLVAIKKAA